MRRRRHPVLPRVAAAVGVVVIFAAAAALWHFRPSLPHITFATPVTTAIIRQGLLWVIWLLAFYILLTMLIRAAHVIVHGPAWQRDAILPGVISSPPPSLPSVPLSERFQPLMFVPPRPRPDTRERALERTDTATATPTKPQKLDVPFPAELPLSISLLGPLRIDGTDRPPKRVRTRELIAYLALHPRGASRDELTEALWPAQDPKKTRPRLWESASDARAALGDAWIVEGERYRLDRSKVRIDLDQLDRLLAESEPQALEAALELWRGEPLQGSDYSWADGHIHRLSATLICLLERAGNARLEQGDARGALELAEKAIALDQFHEASWRLALQADYTLGLRESITRRYDDLAHALDEQLGLQPTRETRAMYRQLLGQD
jgi:DNA-binding SARP family transcriptional activator